MSSPPIDTSGIDQQFPDMGHEAIRQAVLNAIATVWTEHQALVDQVTALTARVSALENTPPLP